MYWEIIDIIYQEKIDILIIVQDGKIPDACVAIDALGFQRQSGGLMHSDDRPMREASLAFENEIFRVHAHISSKSSPLPSIFLSFRDLLRSRPDLVVQYVENKKSVIAEGLTDRASYTHGKSEFIQSVLKR